MRVHASEELTAEVFVNTFQGFGRTGTLASAVPTRCFQG